jgi:hypothetical protein
VLPTSALGMVAAGLRGARFEGWGGRSFLYGRPDVLEF